MLKLQVILSNFEKEIIDVPEWDSLKFSEEMKDKDSTGIAIGDQYMWKIDVRHVKKYVENTEEGSN